MKFDDSGIIGGTNTVVAALTVAAAIVGVALIAVLEVMNG